MADSYATTDRLAIYLEIGWSDYLIEPKATSATAEHLPYPNPLEDYVLPHFPIRVAKLARSWADQQGSTIKSYCDVGGATGRTVFEINGNFSGLERLALIEPSRTFCTWAERLLKTGDELPEFPAMLRAGRPALIKAHNRPPPLPDANARLSIVNTTLERYQPSAKFDLVTCLNVVDRHPYPRTLIGSLANILADDGLLVISCPFDFRVETTPDRGDWIDDLKDLFGRSGSWTCVGEEQIYYEFRSSNRKWTRFASQIVCMRRQA